MSTRDSGGQEQTSRSGSEADETVVDSTPTDVRDRVDKLDEDVDALLDEIDDVLESNAEEFVKGYIQKGGE